MLIVQRDKPQEFCPSELILQMEYISLHNWNFSAVFHSWALKTSFR